MVDKNQLLKKYYQEHSLIDSDIKSFNNFIDTEMQKIVNDIGDITPTIIPEDINEFKIKLNNVFVGKPQIVEADGSKRNIFPVEARLRKITYAAPLKLEISAYVDGIQRENFESQVGRLPVMLKSKICHLSELGREELIKKGEDPDDLGGYFILNGNERILITVEDLVPNKVFVQKNKIGPAKYTAKLFSERGAYRIPHLVEQLKDGIIYISFTRFKKMPIIPVIKALGIKSDQEIMKYVSSDKEYEEVFINLINSNDVQTEEDALNFLAQKGGMNHPPEILHDRVKEQLDKFLLPHLGTEPKDRITKAYNLCKIVKKILQVSREEKGEEDKDHYKNKRLKLSGDLLNELFSVNLRILVNDILYNFQRLVKRGKFHSIKIIIRDKLLSSRMQSAMATGVWPSGRKGISQNIARVNFLDTVSHLQRVNSLLSSSQENFDARALHGTHFGRLCAIETPEGTSIGLRKNLALLTQISNYEKDEDKIKKTLEGMGLGGLN